MIHFLLDSANFSIQTVSKNVMCTWLYDSITKLLFYEVCINPDFCFMHSHISLVFVYYKYGDQKYVLKKSLNHTISFKVEKAFV